MSRVLVLCAALAAAPVQAQVAAPCDWQAAAQAIVEPWEDNTRTFANGEVRVAHLDTIEPALGAAWLLVLSPPRGELGARQCRLIGLSETMGFPGMDFASLAAGYDPSTGLVLTLDVTLVSDDGATFTPRRMAVTVNQATGAIVPRLAETSP